MKEIRQFFQDLDNIEAEIALINTVNYPYPTTPYDFLESAERDLNKELPESTSNSLANTKRALDSQLDYFFKAYGLAKLSQSWGTGQKIRVVGNLGLVPNRLLHKVNEARNDLEHRFARPSTQTAMNAVDIVGLFIAATDMYLYPIHSSACFYNQNQNKSLILQIISNEAIEASIFHRKASSMDFLSLPDRSIEINAISLNHDFFFLLTFLLHYRRFYMQRCSRFFKNLEYLKKERVD